MNMTRGWKIFALALTIKLSVLALWLHIKPGPTSWGVNEAGTIARSLVLNHSYGGAFHDAPGPTVKSVAAMRMIAPKKTTGAEAPSSIPS
jgi:hypothetical protein